VDIPSLVSLGIAVMGLGGLVFTALRYRRDDTTAILAQQDTIMQEMRGINEELRQTAVQLRSERDALREQVRELKGDNV
jgi:hypothetical protein